MATKFEELVNGMVNVGFGAAALTVEKSREALTALNDKGEQVRADSTAPDFARSMSDVFEQAGGAFSDVTDRLADSSQTAAERVLDELILARTRALSKAERTEFLAHVRDLVDSVDDATVTVEVESVETVETVETESETEKPADPEQSE